MGATPQATVVVLTDPYGFTEKGFQPEADPSPAKGIVGREVLFSLDLQGHQDLLWIYFVGRRSNPPRAWGVSGRV